MNTSGLFNGFYQGKKVFVTGNTGFKGSWLSIWLSALGAEVVGYALEPASETGMFRLCGLDKESDAVYGDIRDSERLFRALNAYRPEIVFHLAAQAIVSVSYKAPVDTLETNIMGAVNLYEAVRKTDSVKAVVAVTSDKCYANKEKSLGYVETDELGGDDPYSCSKACVELIASAYANSYFNARGVRLVTARAGNVIGGGDWSENRLVPDCMRALLGGREIEIRNPQSVRPWQHVLEPLSGYLWLGALASGGRCGGAWNFGPEKDDIITVEELIRLLIQRWGKGNYRINDANSFRETCRLMLDISKAKALLGWKPVYRIAEAAEKTADWYREYQGGTQNMLEYSKNQISEYCEKAARENTAWAAV